MLEVCDGCFCGNGKLYKPARRQGNRGRYPKLYGALSGREPKGTGGRGVLEVSALSLYIRDRQTAMMSGIGLMRKRRQVIFFVVICRYEIRHKF